MMIPFGQTMMMTNRSIDGRISSCVISNIARHTSKNIPDEGVNIIFAGLLRERLHEAEQKC